MLVGLGYCARTFDFCGGSIIGWSKGKTTDMSVLTEVEDLKAVMQYCRNNGQDKVHLLGCSQGGFVSAIVAAEQPENVLSLVLLYPALCIPDDARNGHMMFARFDPQNVPERFWCGPMRLGAVYVQDVINMDPFEKIRGYDGPVLYLQGTADTVVDISYARRAKEEYGNCRYVEIEGGEHMFRGEHDETAKEEIRKFMENR